MASTLHVIEYQTGKSHNGGGVDQVALEPPIAEYVLDFTSGAATSATLNANTGLVRLKANAACSVQFAVSPSPTTANQPLSATETQFSGVAPGTGLKIGVIANGLGY